jgi:hypothetical protein
MTIRHNVLDTARHVESPLDRQHHPFRGVSSPGVESLRHGVAGNQVSILKARSFTTCGGVDRADTPQSTTLLVCLDIDVNFQPASAGLRGFR